MAQIIRLTVPAEAAYARTVRMTAANLAVVCELGLDEVEDVRMAAEEGFIYACATHPAECEVSFSLEKDEVRMAFALGEAELDEADDAGFDLDLVGLLLESVCDEVSLSDDALTLNLVKKAAPYAQ